MRAEEPPGRVLNVMEAAVPRQKLEAPIEPHYPKADNGRQPVDLSSMLRCTFLQQWLSLPDPGAEDALYGAPVLAALCGRRPWPSRGTGRDDDPSFPPLAGRA